jgi:hypothetical protein
MGQQAQQSQQRRDRRGGTSQQGRQGRQSQPVDEGLQYGGEARHDHRDTHVGAQQTFGAPSREERRQQRAAESSEPQGWVEEARQYPVESTSHEQYAHDPQEHSPLGRGLEGSRE